MERHPRRQSREFLFRPPSAFMRFAKAGNGAFDLLGRSPKHPRGSLVSALLQESFTRNLSRAKSFLQDRAEQLPGQSVRANVLVAQRRRIDQTAHHQCCATNPILQGRCLLQKCVD